VSGGRLALALPDVAYRDSYLAAAREMLVDEGRAEDDALRAQEHDFAGFVARLIANHAGVDLAPGHVAQTDFWLIEDGAWVGKVGYRHHLTPNLERFGGHLGYVIRPSRRGHGLATRGLGLVLDHLRATPGSPARVLVTCDTTNPASRRVIEKNGGVLQDVIEVEGRTEPCMRWWIAL
jgi:predicted acetyltransferase